jgi:hypothetical protein
MSDEAKDDSPFAFLMYAFLMYLFAGMMLGFVATGRNEEAVYFGFWFFFLWGVRFFGFALK